MALDGKQFSHYRVLSLIGKGGMGEVYLIEDIQVQRQIAAKVIEIEMAQVPSEQEAASNTLRLFWREAMAIARLDHPSILPLYDHGETTIDGLHFAYLIIPYRPEGSLVTWLRQRAQTQQTQQLTLKQVEHVIQQAGQALQYAHDHQTMHLDIKPANFLVRSRSANDDYPDLLLSDFGIARLAHATSSVSQHVRGTPTYMAPEQLEGQPVFASDQYALAVMAYELLTGNPPFQGDPLSVMFAHAYRQPKPARDLNPLLPSTVDLVLQHALAKKPEERFPSVAVFVQELQAAFQGVNKAATLRVLRPSPATPTSQTPNIPSSAGDLRATLVINSQEAIHGAARTLNLMNGRSVNVQIPPGAQSGQVLILIGQGETAGPGTIAGNLYLTLSVVEASTQASLATPNASFTYRSPQLAQSFPPPSAMAFAQKSISPSPIVPKANTFSSQDLVTLPSAPIPVQTPRRRPPLIVAGIFLIILLLLGGGSLGIFQIATDRQHTQATATAATLRTHAQATATAATLRGHARTTATAATLKTATGKIWHSQQASTSYDLRGVTWSGSQFVAIGYSGTILTSPDGHSWTPQSSGTSGDLADIAWSGSQFVAVGFHPGGGSIILTSPDGHAWTSQSSGTSNFFRDIVWSGSQFVIIGDEGYGGRGIILTSPDGHSWTSQYFGTSAYLLGIAWSGSQFVVVGYHSNPDNEIILTSPDGRAWTFHNSGTSGDLEDIAWSGSRFVTVGAHGTILTSPDGHAWTPQNSGISAYLYGVAWSSSQFVVVGSGGTVLTSPDGRTWTSQNSGTSAYLFDIAWSGSQFVVVGYHSSPDNGVILTSP